MTKIDNIKHKLANICYRLRLFGERVHALRLKDKKWSGINSEYSDELETLLRSSTYYLGTCCKGILESMTDRSKTTLDEYIRRLKDNSSEYDEKMIFITRKIIECNNINIYDIIYISRYRHILSEFIDTSPYNIRTEHKDNIFENILMNLDYINSDIDSIVNVDITENTQIHNVHIKSDRSNIQIGSHQSMENINN